MSSPPISRSRANEILRGLIFLVTLLPIFYFPNIINLYRLPKETLFAFITAVLCWLWLLNKIRAGKHQSHSLALILPLCLYLLMSGLSLVNALNPMEGARDFLNLALGIALFWIAVDNADPESFRSLSQWTVFGATLVSIVGIVQAWGVEIPTLVQVAPPSSTFGNKNMAAQYILLVIPVAYYLLLSASEPPKEWFHSSMAAIITTYFVYTGTRAAWGGCAVALLILWLGLRARGYPPRELLSFGKRKWSFLIGIAIFVLGMKTIPPYFVPSFSAHPTITRLQSMLELESDPSAQGRFAIWANSLAIFRDHPVLGVGKGNFQFIYPLYNRRLVKDPSFTVEAKAAEAHNDYIQLLAEVGFLGTTAFLWTLVLLARRYWRSMNEELNPPLLAVGLALTAILLEAFWDFPFAHPVPTAFFWIYAGFLWRLSEDPHSQGAPPAKKNLALAVMTLLALSATAASILTFMHLRAEFYFSRANFGDYHVKGMAEKLDRAEEDFNQATYLYPYDFRYHHWKAVLMLRKGRPQEALQANIRALTLNPYHINTLNNLGVIYTALGNIPKAIQAFETTLRIWPDYLNVHNNLGQLYERIGAKEKAIEEFRNTIRIDPTNKLASEKLTKLLNGP